MRLPSRPCQHGTGTRHDRAVIAGREYLLPAPSSTVFRPTSTCACDARRIDFLKYRKVGVDAKVVPAQ